MARLELSMEEWLYTVSDRVKQIREYSKKAIIHVSGASASGKTFSSEILVLKLQEEGHRCLLFSTDNYYKGISRLLSDKVNLNYYDLKLDSEHLASIIRSTIKEAGFEEKFKKENVDKITMDLKKAGYTEVEKLVEKILLEFSRINFDEPSAVNIKKVSEDINTLLKDDTSIVVPKYSMFTGEPTLLEENTKYSNDYDVIIIEGIYSMNKDILDNLDESIQIKTFIDSDNKTLLVRRLKRDIIDGRSSMFPEMNLHIALDIVIPAFEKYILNDKQSADVILLSNYTLVEARSPSNVSIQEKIKVSKEEVDEIMKFLQSYPLKENIEEIDYYFANSYELDFEKQHLIRVRLEDNKLHSLVHKSISEQRSDGKTIRPQQIFIKDNEFGVIYKDIDQLIKSFDKSHFHVLFTITKTRKKYWVNDVTFMVDRVDGLGYYVELCVYDRNNINQINLLKEKLNLMNKEKVGSYFEEKANSLQKENEIKFLIKEIPFDLGKKDIINQKYLSVDSSEERVKIEKNFVKKIEWDKIKHVRIRKENDNRFFLTLKGEGDISRLEIEKRIDFYAYTELSKFKMLGEINKNRSYLKLDKKLTLSIDEYDDGLITGEVEYSLFDYSEKDVEKLVNQYFKDAKNITFDHSYKNFSLAIKRSEDK